MIRRHGWPAAFAAMSAVAAALLFALLVRPEGAGLHEIATNERVAETPEQISVDHPKFDGVLTTRDTHLGDVQSRLAMRDIDQTRSHFIAVPACRRRSNFHAQCLASRHQ